MDSNEKQQGDEAANVELQRRSWITTIEQMGQREINTAQFHQANSKYVSRVYRDPHGTAAKAIAAEQQRIVNAYDGLSNIEQRIFRLYSEGHDAQQVADTLAKSIKAITVHTTHICRALKLSNIQEAPSIAETLDLAISKGITPIAPTLTPRQRMASLSRRETQVVMHLTSGQMQQDIAKALNISPLTLSTLRRRAFEKLGVGSDAAFFHFAIAAELVPLPSAEEWPTRLDAYRQLSDSEQQLFQQRTGGTSNKAISVDSNLARSTTSKHYVDICKQLGVANMRDAVILAEIVMRATPSQEPNQANTSSWNADVMPASPRRR